MNILKFLERIQYHWFDLILNRFVVLCLYLKAKLWFDVNFNSQSVAISSIDIDVVIPVIERDLEILWYTIKSIKKHIMHNINKIYIIAPKSDKIINFCKENWCQFIDEDSILPIKKKDIWYFIDWIDRSWWIYQQLLKYWMKDFVEKEYFLVTESEAVFLQNRRFEYNGKFIMPVSSAIPHIPYFKMLEKLTWNKYNTFYSFTSHHSLISKKILGDLLIDIEKKSNTKWFESIIANLSTNDVSCVPSDYETYWQYFYKCNKNQIILEHWFNLDLQRKYLDQYDDIIKKLEWKNKVVSFSWYLN